MVLGASLSTASYAASPFLMKHSTVTQMEQAGEGRAQFSNQQETVSKQPRKPVTLAESLVHFRQCHMKDQQSLYGPSKTRDTQFQSTLHTVSQSADFPSVNASADEQNSSSDDSNSSSQSTKVFLTKP